MSNADPAAPLFARLPRSVRNRCFSARHKKYPERFGFLDGGGSRNIMIPQAPKEQPLSPDLKARFEKETERIAFIAIFREKGRLICEKNFRSTK